MNKKLDNVKTKINSLKMKTANIVAIIIIITVYVLPYILLYVPIPETNKETFNNLSMENQLIGLAAVVYFLYNYSRKGQATTYDNNNRCPNCGR